MLDAYAGFRACGITGAQCDARVRTLSKFMLLNSSLRRASGTGASVQKRVTPVEGFTSRPSHCWVVFAEPEVSQLAWAPCGWLVRLAPFEPGSSRGGYLSGI